MTLGIYIQVPFCQTKCTYCNFHTGVVSRDRYEPYAEAVCRDIAESAASRNSAAIAGSNGILRGRSFSSDNTAANYTGALAPEESSAGPVDTAYFGGGTPSLIEPAALGKILDTLRRAYATELSEVTLEADPETITSQKASAWLATGFNRVSLGVQSFDDRELQAAGRMHRRADISRSAEILRAAGFRNISMDLIAGLPHQTRESWEESVTQLLRIHPEHISIYMLEIDEGSRLGRESLAGGARYSAEAIPDDDSMADFYESAGARLAAAGYDHYEISNWGLSGRHSQHNLKYWRREPYLGFGAGAHSFDGVTRWANVHDSARYVALIEQGASPREQIETVTPEQAFEEEFFLGLRQLDGIDFARIERDYKFIFGERLAILRQRIDTLRAEGFLEIDGARVRIAPGRLSVSSEVFSQLLC